MPTVNEAYLFRFEPVSDAMPAYLWSGVGDLDVAGDTLVGPSVTRYKGIGTLTGLPTLQNLINAIADRAEFTMSGVDPIILVYADDDSEAIQGALVRIGSVAIGDDGHAYGPTDWEWEGEADTLTIDEQGQENGKRVRSITISVGTATVSRSTSALPFFTDADQRKRSQDDAFFSHIAGINQTVTRRFGPR